MRKIKFRGWNGEKIGMLEPQFHGNINEIFSEENGIYMQYTGLKDKNGKEIYEGDIVEFNNCDYQRTAGHLDDEIVRGKVTFAFGGWMVEAKNGDYDLYSALINDEELKIIGNVFENPELLEVRHD